MVELEHLAMVPLAPLLLAPSHHLEGPAAYHRRTVRMAVMVARAWLRGRVLHPSRPQGYKRFTQVPAAERQVTSASTPRVASIRKRTMCTSLPIRLQEQSAPDNQMAAPLARESAARAPCLLFGDLMRSGR